MNVLIAIPSNTHIWAHTVQDLVALVGMTSMVKEIELGFVNIQGALLPISRDNVAVYAIQNGFDFIYS